MGVLLKKWMFKVEECGSVGRFSKLIIILYNCRVTLKKSHWYLNNLIKKIITLIYGCLGLLSLTHEFSL